jgi:hypothetical protein
MVGAAYGDRARRLLAFPSVARGHYSLCSDATMGQRLDVSDSTARISIALLTPSAIYELPSRTLLRAWETRRPYAASPFEMRLHETQPSTTILS